MTGDVYDSAFFEQLTPGSLSSARAVLPVLFRYSRPDSVVDVGCGLGPWLKAAIELGVTDAVGIDGEYVDTTGLLIPRANYRTLDLREPITLNRRFDLAISLEVAEHLPICRSESFVDDLVALSDVILFSAALPYQGGTNHINEQWLEFWALIFRKHGYVPCDLLRQEVWGNPNVEFWYSQNLVVFCTPQHARDAFPSESVALRRPLSHPHPLTFLVNAARYRPLAAIALQAECDDYRQLLQAYQEGHGTVPVLAVPAARDEADAPLFPRSRTLILDANTELATSRDTAGRLAIELAASQDEVSRFRTALEGRECENRALGIEVETSRAEVARSRTALEVRECETRDLRNQIIGLSEALDAQASAFQQQSQEAAWVRTGLQEAIALAAEKQNDLETLRNSLTWRWTKPFRWCAGLLIHLFGKAK
jgi:SAM-dependent methyltransferase